MMIAFEELTEGYFIRTDENLIFEVKGGTHPQNRLIAYLRYIPVDEESDSFRKVYDLDERESYLKTHYPHYLWHSDVLGRTVQSVEFDLIDEILSPRRILSNLQSSKGGSNLEKLAVSLVDKMVVATGIDYNSIGITGSILTGTASTHSDIDLVIYGENQCRVLYSKLNRLFDMYPDICHYSGEQLKKHVEFRWKSLPEHYNTLKSIEKHKLLQGIFCGVDFFIRLVKLPDEFSRSYEEMSIEYLGEHQSRCRIIDDMDSIFTPCEYRVEAERDPVQIDRVVSYRGRFTEHAKSNAIVNVRGRLEKVRLIKSDIVYHQIVLGESPLDFMLPV